MSDYSTQLPGSHAATPIQSESSSTFGGESLNSIESSASTATLNQNTSNSRDSPSLSNFSTSTTVPGSNANRTELKISHSQLQLFLNACKLLDLAIILPSDILPQFQLHRWAFLGDVSTSHLDLNTILFNNRHDGFSADERIGTPSGTLNAYPDSGPVSFTGSTVSGDASDTSSMMSTGTHDSGQSSLPSYINSSNSVRYGNSFVPHIVKINYYLNQLTVRFSLFLRPK